MPSNYIFRIIKELEPDSYNPTGTWQELRHTSTSLTSDHSRNRINGLALHHGRTQDEINFQEVAGDISMVLTKTDLQYFTELICGNAPVGNTCSFGGDRFNTVTIEQYDIELDKTYLYRSVGVSGVTLSYTHGQVSNMTVTFTGGYVEFPDTRPSLQGAVINRNTDQIGTSVLADVTMNYKTTTIPLFVNSVQVQLSNNLETIRPLGVDYNVPYGVGHTIPQGNLTIYSDLEAFGLWTQKFNNEPVEIIISDNNSVVTLPRCYLGGQIPPDNGLNTEVNINLAFEATYDEDTAQIATLEIL